MMPLSVPGSGPARCLLWPPGIKVQPPDCFSVVDDGGSEDRSRPPEQGPPVGQMVPTYHFLSTGTHKKSVGSERHSCHHSDDFWEPLAQNLGQAGRAT